MCFEAPDDTSIKRLDEGCQVWCKEHNMNICWLVCDIVSGEVVNSEHNSTVLCSEFDILFLHPAVDNVSNVIAS